MDAVNQKVYPVWFGGSYRECWAEDYKLSVVYEGRRQVLALRKNKVWVPAGGDAELAALLRSPDCPEITQTYFQAAASVSAAAALCQACGLPALRMGECFRADDNPLAAPELMRHLMDDEGLSLQDAYQVTTQCCRNLSTFGVDLGQLYPLQPRTAHVISLLRGCYANVLAVEHDAHNAAFRSPLGAVTEGERIQLSLRVLSGRAEKATLILMGDRMYRQYPMAQIGKSFTVTIKLPDEACALWYYFQIETRDSSHWLCADETGWRGKLCGSEGEGFRLTVYRKGFETPAWAKEAVCYQIFPDRFFDGDPSIDNARTTARGSQPVQHRAWKDLPANSGAGAADGDAWDCNDFFGGDIAGITKKLDYLKGLGITAIYLNPVYAASSNHRYDARDYNAIDPLLGDLRPCRR